MTNLNSDKIKVVLFKSKERFSAFHQELEKHNVEIEILDFDQQDWIFHDYSSVDIIIYYPSFMYSSNYPLALQEVYDNLIFLHNTFPAIKMFPDPRIIKYYNDKYRQYLFLERSELNIPKTIPLFSSDSLELADNTLGYPMVVKNRYGAGGASVFKVNNRKELNELYRISKLDLFNFGSFKYLSKIFTKRIFYYHLIKEKKLTYPLLSTPLLAQKFINIEKDLKTVVGNGKVIEGHWRIQANNSMWKMNIDDGGIGEWSYIPQEAIDISEELARKTDANWINIDLIISGDNYYISEFSPVWHHYAYKEKPSFVYKDDYNIDTPLEISLNLEKIIVESLIN
ncbi:MAG: ATP-grasp domain-containing protein [Candidatus Thiodiazotropha sp.]